MVGDIVPIAPLVLNVNTNQPKSFMEHLTEHVKNFFEIYKNDQELIDKKNELSAGVTDKLIKGIDIGQIAAEFKQEMTDFATKKMKSILDPMDIKPGNVGENIGGDDKYKLFDIDKAILDQKTNETLGKLEEKIKNYGDEKNKESIEAFNKLIVKSSLMTVKYTREDLRIKSVDEKNKEKSLKILKSPLYIGNNFFYQGIRSGQDEIINHFSVANFVEKMFIMSMIFKYIDLSNVEGHTPPIQISPNLVSILFLPFKVPFPNYDEEIFNPMDDKNLTLKKDKLYQQFNFFYDSMVNDLKQSIAEILKDKIEILNGLMGDTPQGTLRRWLINNGQLFGQLINLLRLNQPGRNQPSTSIFINKYDDLIRYLSQVTKNRTDIDNFADMDKHRDQIIACISYYNNINDIIDALQPNQSYYQRLDVNFNKQLIDLRKTFVSVIIILYEIYLINSPLDKRRLLFQLSESIKRISSDDAYDIVDKYLSIFNSINECSDLLRAIPINPPGPKLDVIFESFLANQLEKIKAILIEIFKPPPATNNLYMLWNINQGQLMAPLAPGVPLPPPPVPAFHDLYKLLNNLQNLSVPPTLNELQRIQNLFFINLKTLLRIQVAAIPAPAAAPAPLPAAAPAPPAAPAVVPLTINQKLLNLANLGGTYLPVGALPVGALPVFPENLIQIAVESDNISDELPVLVLSFDILRRQQENQPQPGSPEMSQQILQIAVGMLEININSNLPQFQLQPPSPSKLGKLNRYLQNELEKYIGWREDFFNKIISEQTKLDQQLLLVQNIPNLQRFTLLRPPNPPQNPPLYPLNEIEFFNKNPNDLFDDLLNKVNSAVAPNRTLIRQIQISIEEALVKTYLMQEEIILKILRDAQIEANRINGNLIVGGPYINYIQQILFALVGVNLSKGAVLPAVMPAITPTQLINQNFQPFINAIDAIIPANPFTPLKLAQLMGLDQAGGAKQNLLNLFSQANQILRSNAISNALNGTLLAVPAVGIAPTLGTLLALQQAVVGAPGIPGNPALQPLLDILEPLNHLPQIMPVIRNAIEQIGKILVEIYIDMVQTDKVFPLIPIELQRQQIIQQTMQLETMLNEVVDQTTMPIESAGARANRPKWYPIAKKLPDVPQPYYNINFNNGYLHPDNLKELTDLVYEDARYNENQSDMMIPIIENKYPVSQMITGGKRGGVREDGRGRGRGRGRRTISQGTQPLPPPTNFVAEITDNYFFIKDTFKFINDKIITQKFINDYINIPPTIQNTNIDDFHGAGELIYMEIAKMCFDFHVRIKNFQNKSNIFSSIYKNVIMLISDIDGEKITYILPQYILPIYIKIIMETAIELKDLKQKISSYFGLSISIERQLKRIQSEGNINLTDDLINRFITQKVNPLVASINTIMNKLISDLFGGLSKILKFHNDVINFINYYNSGKIINMLMNNNNLPTQPVILPNLNNFITDELVLFPETEFNIDTFNDDTINKAFEKYIYQTKSTYYLGNTFTNNYFDNYVNFLNDNLDLEGSYDSILSYKNNRINMSLNAANKLTGLSIGNNNVAPGKILDYRGAPNKIIEWNNPISKMGLENSLFPYQSAGSSAKYYSLASHARFGDILKVIKFKILSGLLKEIYEEVNSTNATKNISIANLPVIQIKGRAEKILNELNPNDLKLDLKPNNYALIGKIADEVLINYINEVIRITANSEIIKMTPNLVKPELIPKLETNFEFKISKVSKEVMNKLYAKPELLEKILLPNEQNVEQFVYPLKKEVHEVFSVDPGEKFGHKLCYHINTETIEKDINGVNFNLQDSHGNTPLHYAIDILHPKLIKILINKNAAVNSYKNLEGVTPFEYFINKYNVMHENLDNVDNILKLFETPFQKEINQISNDKGNFMVKNIDIVINWTLILFAFSIFDEAKTYNAVNWTRQDQAGLLTLSAEGNETFPKKILNIDSDDDAKEILELLGSVTPSDFASSSLNQINMKKIDNLKEKISILTNKQNQGQALKADETQNLQKYKDELNELQKPINKTNYQTQIAPLRQRIDTIAIDNNKSIIENLDSVYKFDNKNNSEFYVYLWKKFIKRTKGNSPPWTVFNLIFSIDEIFKEYPDLKNNKKSFSVERQNDIKLIDKFFKQFIQKIVNDTELLDKTIEDNYSYKILFDVYGHVIKHTINVSLTKTIHGMIASVFESLQLLSPDTIIENLMKPPGVGVDSIETIVDKLGHKMIKYVLQVYDNDLDDDKKNNADNIYDKIIDYLTNNKVYAFNLSDDIILKLKTYVFPYYTDVYQKTITNMNRSIISFVNFLLVEHKFVEIIMSIENITP